MPYYLIQVAYTPEAIAGLVEKPEDREAAARALVEKLGGTMEGFWYAFGDWDVAAIGNLPDNVSAAAASLAASRTGQFKAFKTTPLMTMQEARRAMEKAGSVPFKAPGKS